MKFKSLLLFIIALGLGSLAFGQDKGGIYRISNETDTPITVTYTLEYHFGGGQCANYKETLVSQIPSGVVDFNYKTPQALRCSSANSNNVAVITINQINTSTSPPCTFSDNLKANESIATMVISKTADGDWNCYPKTDLQ